MSSGTRSKLVAAILTGTVGVGAALALTERLHSEDSSSTASHPTEAVATSRPHTSAGRQRLTRQEQRTVDDAVARLRAMQPVAAGTSSEHPPIENPARQQPDLYAAAFAEQLLTQDYRSSRDALLAWVQSESVPCNEPSVVGLTPAGVRDRLAVASLVDATGGPAPIPSSQTWAALGRRHGYTAVKIRRVITPPTWTSAVAAGKISDPGATAREVDADLTLHTVDAGRAQSQTYSVALTMNLEGPPTRDDYGFVTAVTYHAVEGGD